ncbi:hypothetical protein K7X08_010461 [Anisodus acutangulus]|uniref:RRM Nup35-type domain-containing protein n=1 Tax=Anisodus acutangulus TaxID=402998 RepID=A0A9Q1RRR6_9SOLA|nr:hypothetical protein K7X08_010461 [Anisodus acutangulus]
MKNVDIEVDHVSSKEQDVNSTKPQESNDLMSELRITEVTTVNVSSNDQDDEDSIQTEALDKKNGGDNNSTVLLLMLRLTIAQWNKWMMEKLWIGNAQQIGDHVEKSCNTITTKEILNAEGVSNINIEVTVDKEFIDDGRDTSSKEDYIILSTENSITEEVNIGERVQVSTVGDITVIPIEEALRTGCYHHSKGDGEDDKGKGSPIEGIIHPGALITLPPQREVARPEIRNNSFLMGKLDDQEWVTVYRFSPIDTNPVLREFEKYGVILKYILGPRDANWMHILYHSCVDAQKALNKNGMQINGVLMIGVKPVDNPMSGTK